MRKNPAAISFLFLFNFVAFNILVACASRPTSRFGSEPNLDSKAEGAAYAAEGFTFSKNMPIHPNSPYDFYFRTCSHDDGKVYYSKTSYDCTMLP